MQVGWLDQQNLGAFRSLLLPEEAAALDAGEPVPVLGLTEGEVACGAAAAWLRGGTLDVRPPYASADYRRQGGGRRKGIGAPPPGLPLAALPPGRGNSAEPGYPGQTVGCKQKCLRQNPVPR